MTKTHICPFCGTAFIPSRYHPVQKVCGAKECQRKRRAQYHRTKILNDPEYAKQCQASQQQWRENNKAQQQQYRRDRKAVAEKDATRAEIEQRRQLITLIKKGTAMNLSRSNAEVWILSTANLADVEKAVAAAKLIILHVELGCSLLVSS